MLNKKKCNNNPIKIFNSNNGHIMHIKHKQIKKKNINTKRKVTLTLNNIKSTIKTNKSTIIKN